MSRSNVNYAARTLELFAYILLYAPDFPPEDETRTEGEFAKLLDHLQSIRSDTRYPRATQWLDLAILECQDSLSAFSGRDTERGLDLVQSSEQHFRDYLRRRTLKPQFVVGPDGSVEKCD